MIRQARMRILLFLCNNATRILTWVLGWKIDHSELDQFEITCNKCGGLDECHCRSPEIYWNKFSSPFDSITMFGKSMPKIFHEAGLDDDDIEIFRRGFNKDFKLDDIIFPDIISPNDGLAKLKDSMKDGYIPPEERK